MSKIEVFTKCVSQMFNAILEYLRLPYQQISTCLLLQKQEKLKSPMIILTTTFWINPMSIYSIYLQLNIRYDLQFSYLILFLNHSGHIIHLDLDVSRFKFFKIFKARKIFKPSPIDPITSYSQILEKVVKKHQFFFAFKLNMGVC